MNSKNQNVFGKGVVIMASVSGTSTLSNSLSSIRGYGGLASGLDRDTLIEQMTSGTRSKIAAQGQKKQKIEWKQTAIRDITSKIYDFTSKYTSYASSSNLTSSKLFSRNNITPVGENSSKVSVSGTASSADNMSIARIKQLAKNAGLTTQNVSTRTLETGLISNDLSVKTDVSTIEGDALYIKYGTDTYTVKMDSKEEYNYKNPEDAMKAINEQLKEVSISTSAGSKETLGDVMEAVYDSSSGKVTFRTKTNSDGTNAAHGNIVALNGGTGSILQDLGFLKKGQNFSELTDDEKSITSKGLTGSNAAVLTESKSIAQQLGDKQIAFSYNGEAKWITTDDYSVKLNATLEDVQKDLQKKLDEAYGKNRIKVELEKGEGDESAKSRITFKTVKPDGKGGSVSDESSTLAITAGDGVMGRNGVFGVKEGASNRVNQSENLKNAGLSNSAKIAKLADEDGNYNLVINNVKVEGITKDSSIKDIIDKINSTEGIGVKVEYQEMSDRFVMTATDNGASGAISFESKDEDGNVVENNIAELLFGVIGSEGSDDNPLKTTYTEGQDAILKVKYPGSSEEIEITRASNTFTLDGLNITLKGTFGYDFKDAGKTETTTYMFGKDLPEDAFEDIVRASNEGNEVIINNHAYKAGEYNLVMGDDKKTILGITVTGTTIPIEMNDVEEITFDSSVDADKAAETVKEMIDAFNEILTLVNKDVGEKPDRDYQPLTDEQKEELSDDEIERWEEKAKQGILFGDSDLRMMSDALGSVISGKDRTALSKMGITVSTSYSDNNKLVFDEEKFKAALLENPDEVMDVFNRKVSTDENGNTIEGGLLTRIKDVMDRYGSMTGATKGILVERAGSIYAPTTVLSNSLQKELDSIDNYIERLQDKLETETDRYISQFTSLETLISQMNSQSEYLMSMFSA